MENLFTEVYISQALIPKSFDVKEVIIEGANSDQKKYILEGEFQRAEAKNKNGRYYTEELLGRETNKLINFIRLQNGLPSELDHPLPGKEQKDIILAQRCTLENACALIDQLDMNNKVVYGRCEILYDDGAQGQKLYSLVKRGYKPGISSRGLGGKPLMENGMLMVPANYNMVTYDMVSNPSTHNAILESIVESEMMFIENQIKEANKCSRNFASVMIDLANKHLEDY